MNYQHFLNNTLPSDTFVVQDVYNDNACFYRAVANQLYYRSQYDKASVIFSKNNRIITKNIDDVLANQLWGYNGTEQTKMANLLQQTARKILYKNRTKIVDEFGISVEDFVAGTHDFSSVTSSYRGWTPIDIYNHIYKTFAGEDATIQTDDGEKKMIERWGGASEQWALSHFFKIPIKIYHLQYFSNNTIRQGRIRKRKASKNSRFKLYQTFGKEYHNPPLHLLYKRTRSGGHYMSLYESES